jgi:ADP-ribosyl-[dinitrogen reductase] hydrolase
MLIEIAIGDAYGAGFEYVAEAMILAKNDLAGYVAHPRHALRPGSYTDDTQMSLAIAEAMLSGEEWTPEYLAGMFVRAFRRDPREGYSRLTYQFLLGVADGPDFVRRFNPASERSGAAMRAGAIGLYPTIPAVLERARQQAAVTHNTPAGIQAAQAAALMAHYGQYRLGPKRDLPAFLATHVPGPWTTLWRGKVGALGVESVSAALTALLRCDRLTDLLRTCIAFSGDVDTVAAIAFAAGSVCEEVEQDLPAHLHDGLERGAYGYDYLQRLDRQLMAWAAAQRL